MNRDLRCQLDLLKPPQKSSVLTKTLKETVKKAQAKQKRGHDQTASERNAIRSYDMVIWCRYVTQRCQSGETPE